MCGYRVRDLMTPPRLAMRAAHRRLVHLADTGHSAVFRRGEFTMRVHPTPLTLNLYTEDGRCRYAVCSKDDMVAVTLNWQREFQISMQRVPNDVVLAIQVLGRAPEGQLMPSIKAIN
jgi:hypothetical protein